MKRISIRSKLYIYIIPIIITGIIISFTMLYFIANQKYSDYLYLQYDQDVEYLKNVSEEMIKTGTVPKEVNILLPDSCTGIRVYNLAGNMVYEQVMENSMMNDIACCDFVTYEIEGYGSLEIYSHCEVNYTEESLDFRRDLILVVIITGCLTLLITLFVINRIANKMSFELNGMAEFAGEIELGILDNNLESNISEIDNIKNSLYNLGIKLSKKERMRKEKIDLIKHQINTPLTIIKTTLEGMLDDVIDIDKKYISRCLTENDRIQEKLDNLYHDIEKNNETLNIEKVQLNEIVTEMVESLKISFIQKGVKVITELGDLTLDTDKNLLISSIYNILTNAYKYTTNGDEVVIKITDKLYISDSGIGINEKDVDKVFDAYFRGSNAAGIKGKGLGLYDTKKNLEKLGYKVYLEKNNRQTTFVIDFRLDDI